MQSIETPKELYSARRHIRLAFRSSSSLLLEISHLIGPRRFIRLIAGLYHVPQGGERFVLFVDVAGSTGTPSGLATDEATRCSTACSVSPRDQCSISAAKLTSTWRRNDCDLAGRQRRQRWSRSALFSRNAGGTGRGSWQLRTRVRTCAPGARQPALYAVVVGEIGDTRRDIVFHGDVMNTAARLEEASRYVSGGFVVSRSARERLESRRKDGPRRSGNVQPARKLEPLEIFGLPAG